MKNIILLLSFFCIFSCESTINVDVASDNKLVIEGYLRVGDSVTVRVSQSADADNYYSSCLCNLEMYITQNAVSHKLIRSGFESYATKHSYTYVYSLPATELKVNSGYPAEFEAHYGDETITAYAEIPELTDIDSFRVIKSLDENGYWNIDNITIYAPFPEGETHYLVDLEVFQTFNYNGETYTFFRRVFRKFFDTSNASSQMVLTTDDSEELLSFKDEKKKTYILRLYTLSNTYSEFRKELQSQNNDGDGLSGIFGQNVTEVNGNVNNAYGIFTVMNQDTLLLEEE